MIEQHYTPEELSSQIRLLIGQLRLTGRNDLLLKAIGVPLLEELRIEAAKGRLSRLIITEDYRFILEDYHKEVELQPVHKAVYLLFLAHPEGIEFKRLADYREELTRYYMATAKIMDKEKVMESVDHLINPLDNAINEKCSRIKKVFLELMDEYTASYYIISSHTQKHIAGSSRIWYERLKVITLPRERDVLDVLNIRIRSDSPHNGDDVETDLLTDMLEFYVVADGLLQVLQLVVVHGLLGLAIKAVAAGLHLHKHHHVVVQRNDVDVPSARLPALHNGISLFL